MTKNIEDENEEGTVGIDDILYYMCPKGHYNSTTWRRWESGERCPTCALEHKLSNWTGIDTQQDKN